MSSRAPKTGRPPGRTGCRAEVPTAASTSLFFRSVPAEVGGFPSHPTEPVPRIAIGALPAELPGTTVHRPDGWRRGGRGVMFASWTTLRMLPISATVPVPVRAADSCVCAAATRRKTSPTTDFHPKWSPRHCPQPPCGAQEMAGMSFSATPFTSAARSVRRCGFPVCTTGVEGNVIEIKKTEP